MNSTPESRPTQGKVKAFRAIIHGRLGLDEAAKERLLLQYSAEMFPHKPARAHFTDLTDFEASQVLDRLNRKVGGSPRRTGRLVSGPTRQGVTRLASQNQLWAIRGLREQLGWPDYRWEGLVQQASGHRRVRTSADARRVIEAAKALLLRSQGQSLSQTTSPAPQEHGLET